MSNEKTLVKLFEKQAKKTPENIAVVYKKTNFTYKKLNEKANHLAHYLKSKHKIQNEELIALFLDKNEQVPISILAILKVIAAYVPIDVNTNTERLKFLLSDSLPKIIISTEKYAKKLKEIISSLDPHIQPFLLILEKLEKETQNFPSSNFENGPKNSQLAYVIYTSGTTGNPKGVMIEHKNVTNTLEAQLSYLKITKSKKIKNFGLFTNYIFDASVSGIFLPLLSGNTLAIAEDLTKININQFIKEKKINIAILPSPLLSLLDEFGNSLKQIIIGGETPNLLALKKLFNAGIQVFQEYGLTETSIASTIKKLDKTTRINNIGKPLNNTYCLVLNENLEICSTEEEGELYIAGDGISRGYLNNPKLTKEKFISNPFQTQEEKEISKKARLYRTGDLVKLNKGGDLEYLGRNDLQIKIRGQRIELIEIENELNKYPQITQSVVVYLKNNNNHGYLAAYYVAEKKLDENSIAMFLENTLPKYMVPSVIFHIYTMPLTPNGKIDRLALPKPTLLKKEGHLAPRTREELKIAEVWSETLGLPIDQIGIRSCAKITYLS